MKKIMSWLENSFAPRMNKVANNPWVATVSSSMMKILPFILTGSLIFFYNVFRKYIPVLPDLSMILNFTFCMLALILSFMIGNQAMDKLGHPQYQIPAGLTSIVTYIMFTQPIIDSNSIMTVDFSRFGPSGMFVAVVVGLLVSLIFHLVAKLKILQDNVSIPDFVGEWINNIIPIFISVAIAMIIVYKLNIDIYNVILSVFTPINNFGFTLPGFILLCLIPAILFSMGISTWFFGAISTPILLAGTAANIAAAANGNMPTSIVCYETIYALSLIPLGGTGATLPLNIMMLISKSKKLKAIGRVCIGPSIFNINEPIAFGAPVVFNPLLMLPMWINSITGPVIIWFAMKLNTLDVPAAAMTTGQVPAPVAYILITQDFRALVFYVPLFFLYWVTWYPFFKVFEKNTIKEENEELELEAV